MNPKYCCPNCKGTDVGKTSVLYELGTSYDEWGMNQTEFAQKLTPPDHPISSDTHGTCGCIGCLGCLVFIFIFASFLTTLGIDSKSASDIAFKTCLALIFLFIILYFIGRPSEKKRVAAEKKHWENEWVCLRCGKRWIPHDAEK